MISECKRCGSTELEHGRLLLGFWRIGFKSLKAGSAATQERILALACRKCGHVEFSLPLSRTP
jgi:hypothetical protein